MSILHLVTLDSACGQHVTEYGFEELARTLNTGGSLRVDVSNVGPGVVLLTLQGITSIDAELNGILNTIKSFTSQFYSVVILIDEKDTYCIKNKLSKESCTFELSGRWLGRHNAGDLFRVTGKHDKVDRFLSTYRSVRVIEETNVVQECSVKKSLELSAAQNAFQLSKEDWEYLKLTHFEVTLSHVYPNVQLQFLEPHSIQLSGNDEDVKMVIRKAYQFLDRRQVYTYCKSRAVVECLKCSWCNDLLRRKWKAANVAATVVVTEHNTAIIRSGAELAIAVHILESAVKEAPPIMLPKEFALSVTSPMWYAMEAAARGKAAFVLDEKRMEIIVAGKAEDLNNVVELIRNLAAPAKSSNASRRTMAASSSAVELVKRYYVQRILCTDLGDTSVSSTSLSIQCDSDQFILEGDPLHVANAEKQLTQLIASIEEIDGQSMTCSPDRISQIEKETCTLIHQQESYYAAPTANVGSSSFVAVPSQDMKNGRKGMDMEVNPHMLPRSAHERHSYGSYENRNTRDLQLQVIRGSVCDQKAHVLVNSITTTLNLQAGKVSTAFAKAAGRPLQEELDRVRKPAKEFSIIHTAGYRLQCDVYHVVLGHRRNQQSDENLEAVIYDCLEMAEGYKRTSIVFPPLGAGGFDYSVQTVVKAFYGAVEKFNREPSQYLKSATCAVFDEKTYKEFKEALRSLNEKHAEKPGRVRSLTNRTAFEHERMNAGFPYSIRCQHFLALHERLWLLPEYSRKKKSTWSPSISPSTVECRQEINATYVMPTFVWRITGKKTDVHRAAQKLAFPENDSGVNEQARGVSGDQRVDYSENRSEWLSTSKDTLRNNSIASGSESSSGVTTTASRKVPKEDLYDENAANLPPAYDQSDDSVLFKRIALQLDGARTKYASYLEPMGTAMFKISRLESYKPEYTEVNFLFKDCHRDTNIEVKEIFRIQDKTLWIQYCEQQEKMKRENPAVKTLQQILWFSCPQDDALGLLKSGHLLNRSSSARQDYGKGAYFYRNATDAASAQVTSSQDTKCIVLASVLTGRVCVGNKSMVTLPQLPYSDKKYDSSVDNEDNPTVFVVYHDAQACPLYYVTFKAYPR